MPLLPPALFTTPPPPADEVLAASVEEDIEECPLRLPPCAPWLGGGGDDDWKIDEVAINFSMYCPRIWFSERRLTFSSFTVSTRWERSARVCCSSRTYNEMKDSFRILTIRTSLTSLV